MILIGFAAFLLFFFNDYNDLKWKKPKLKIVFPVGCVMLVISLALQLPGNKPQIPGVIRWGAIALALCFLILTIKALFFSFPAKNAYGESVGQRMVYTGGLYRLCRHPGVLFFDLMMVCLWLGTGITLLGAAVPVLMDTLLACYEDRCVFPELLDGYREYQNRTPFLIPRAIRK